MKNFREWCLNESQELDTEITIEKLAPIDIPFAEKYYDMFLDLNEMNDGSEEDACIGELTFRATGEVDWYFEYNKYSLLTWFYGSIVDNETGELEPDYETDKYTDEHTIEHFENQCAKIPLKDAKTRIDNFLSLDQNKCKTMLYIYELCYQIHHELTEPEALGSSRSYTDTDIWDLVIDFVKKSHHDFPTILDMVPEWYNIDRILHVLPLHPDYKHKFRGRIVGRNYGLS
jgi:hypothetical protein